MHCGMSNSSRQSPTKMCQKKSLKAYKGCLQKKKTPYGGTLSQPGRKGVKKKSQMCQLKIPFY